MINLKKSVLYILSSLVLVLFCGCGEKADIAPEIGQYDNYDTSMRKTVFVEESTLNVPSGIVYAGECLYVANKEGHCVLKYSDEGVLEKTIGSLGNGDGEFRKPVAITSYGDEIYVANENDGKVQIFDLEGTYKNKFYIEELDNMYLSVLDIEVDESNIYISVVGGDESLLHVYAVTKANGKVSKLGKENMGSLGKGSEDSTYFVQAYDYIEEEGYSGYEAGNSYVADIVEGKIIERFLLPHKYMPSDILVHNDDIYIFSRALTQIDVFDMQGQYVKTIFSEDSSSQNRGLGYITMDEEGNLYLSDQENNSIYKLEKKN